LYLYILDSSGSITIPPKYSTKRGANVARLSRRQITCPRGGEPAGVPFINSPAQFQFTDIDPVEGRC